LVPGIGGPWISCQGRAFGQVLWHPRTNFKFNDLGFPLEKAIQYEKLRKPFVINDLEKQWDIQGLVRSIFTIFLTIVFSDPEPKHDHDW